MERRYAYRALAACGVAALVALAAPGPARASSFDEESRLLVLDEGAAASFGFEGPSELPGGMELYAFDSELRAIDVAAGYTTDVRALEGEGAWIFGGDRAAFGAISVEGLAGELSGRRVEVRLWVRSDGAELSAGLRWISGDWRAQLERGEDVPTRTMGYLTMLPTGRATSDGWRELSTGPVDFTLGSRLEPAYIALFDAHADSAATNPSTGLNPSARLWIDALEIEDLGPARTPDAVCTLVDEEQQCGAEGAICHYGRCVDAVAVEGDAPRGAMRDDYLERRIFEVEAFAGARVAHERLGAFADALRALVDTPPGSFWAGLSRAYEALGDGHMVSPAMRNVEVPPAVACLYPGRADLLPGAPEAPLVFEVDDGSGPASDLEVGDVLTTIDGEPVDDWLARLDRRGFYGADPGARALTRTPRLLAWATELGATASFSRCDQDIPCDAGSVEVIELDLYDRLGADLWAGLPPAWLDRGGPICDYRLERPVVDPGDPDAVRLEGFAGYVERSGRLEVMFNGFPSAQTVVGNRWDTEIREAFLTPVPDRVLLDGRLGPGGSLNAMSVLATRILSPEDRIVAELFPWLVREVDAALLDALTQCASVDDFGGAPCGEYIYLSGVDSRGPGGDARLALLMGYAISSNDFLARFTAARGAETRIFGMGASQGAFGLLCDLPAYLDESRSGSYQCQDTIFSEAGAAPQDLEDGFATGAGVMPDEVVLQKQSDARQGRDTMLEAARQWLDDGM